MNRLTLTLMLFEPVSRANTAALAVAAAGYGDFLGNQVTMAPAG